MSANREPFVVAAGDSFEWNRVIPAYLPSDNWTLAYQISGGVTGDAAPLITAAPDTTGTFFQVNVAPTVTALWIPGTYVLTGRVTNTVTAESHQIYYAELEVTPNLGTGVNTANVQTYAQQQIANLEATLDTLNRNYLLESNIQQTNLIREKRKDIRTELNFWYEKRRNEVALENVRNGRASGQKIVPLVNITSSAPMIGSPNWPFAQP